jgi:hypothetical protein
MDDMVIGFQIPRNNINGKPGSVPPFSTFAHALHNAEPQFVPSAVSPVVSYSSRYSDL